MLREQRDAGPEEAAMPLFLIERNFAEALEGDPDPETAATIKQVNDEIGIQWLFSFLSADKRKTYCLYEAPNPEAIRVAARRLGVPADTIVEVGSEIGPLAAAITPLREQAGATAQPSA
jgi:Nickel responsive protein SCO4226-like